MAQLRSRSKPKYQVMLHIYTKRRDALRIKYNWQRGKPNPKYAAAVKSIARKIAVWRKAVKRIEYREKRLDEISDMVFEYTGVRVWRSIPRKNKMLVLARALFCRYAMEEGIQSPAISLFFGSRVRAYAANLRMTFIRSFKTDKDNQQTWHRFKLRVADQYKTKLKKVA